MTAPTHAIFEPPIVYWTPAIAVSGMLFYTGDALPAWKNDILVGALRTGEIPGTGHLERIMLNRDYQEVRRESLITTCASACGILKWARMNLYTWPQNNVTAPSLK